MSTKIPNFFVVGGPKCGTTALNQYLSTHPNIFVSNKEMHFFGSDLQFGPQFYRRDRTAYLDEFKGWQGQACAGETSVWYLFSQKGAAEIKAFNPDARIIIMLREPSSLLYSLYHQFRCDGNENISSFEEALRAEPDRRAGRRVSRQAYFIQGLAYRTIIRYAEQVQRYYNAFGRDQVHVILYDHFARDTAGTYRRTLDFLGVSSSPADTNIDFGVINGNQTVKSSAFRAILQDPLVRGTAIALRTRLPRPVFSMVQKVGLRLSSLNMRPAARTRFDPELQNTLRREFTPEVERLSALLGRDLSHWTNPVPTSPPADSK